MDFGHYTYDQKKENSTTMAKKKQHVVQ